MRHTRLTALLIVLGVTLTLLSSLAIVAGMWDMGSVRETLWIARWYFLGIAYVLIWWTKGKSPFRLIRDATYFAEAGEKAVLDTLREIPGVLRARFPECLEAVKEERV